MNYDKKCQLLIIGDATVGKTSILSRFANNSFNSNYLATVGLDFFTKDEIFDDTIIRIKIWDTAGQERYKSLTKGFFRNAQGIIIVYDVTNIESFNNLKYWIQSFQNNIDLEQNDVPAIIIGNKIDLPEREVEKINGEKFAIGEKYEYFETSAKSGEGVNEAIRFLVSKIFENPNDYKKNKENKNIKIKGENNNKENKSEKIKKCCGKE